MESRRVTRMSFEATSNRLVVSGQKQHTEFGRKQAATLVG